jgi:hypothetical protein
MDYNWNQKKVWNDRCEVIEPSFGNKFFFLGRWDYGDLVGVICSQNVWGIFGLATCNLVALLMILGLKLTFDMQTLKWTFKCIKK